jgi:hypothetical protein
MTEFTLILGENEHEVYVNLDEETGEAGDVYASPGVLASVGAVERPGRNPLFTHAENPELALAALLAADAVCGGQDDAEFYRLRNLPNPWS